MAREMSIVFRGLIAAVMIASSACTTQAPSHSEASPGQSPLGAERQARVPGEYLVTLAPGVDNHVLSERYGRFGIKDINALGDDTFLLVLSNDPGPQALEKLSRGDSRIIAVQPNLIYWTNRSGAIAK